MDLQIAGKQALVFGGSKGMGYATARQLALEGVHVVIAARTESTLLAAAAQLRSECASTVQHIVADISTPQGRAAALSACPQPDILVNNADGYPPGDYRDWDNAMWHQALEVMMLAPIEMMRQVVDGMRARRFGRIINIVSRSVKAPHAELGLSNGARSGLVGFVGGLSRQTIRDNVTINNVLPGAFDTDAQARHLDKLARLGGTSVEAMRQAKAAQNPAGRFGRTEEIASLIAWLSSSHAGYVTGQSWLMDGGEYPGMF